MAYASPTSRLANVISGYLDEFKKELYTALPAVVEFYNPKTQSASVRPLIQVDELPNPLIHGVPIQFPSGGGASLTFPVKAGDQCLLIFSMLPMDAWMSGDGSMKKVNNRRSHDITDAFAIVGVGTNNKNFNPDPDKVRLQYGELVFTFAEDGSAVLEGSLHVTKDITSDANIRAEKEMFASNITMHDSGVDFNSHVHHYYWTDGSGEANSQKAQ
ncbi:putative baseplate assembly protein [Erwinia phage Panisse]|uniref:Baseplate spike n=2 Tax=Kolesnikvirus TaxID=1985293 RepID=A0AAU8EH86_9CAUD|nr:putative baseplate assembly protein [Erwinia phage SunLIRen]WJN64386.1 putative baseplate assembly protein [Erwinia phage Panisse]WJN64689.1 putative baseplate assembly protein [Erwinia phage Pistou]